MSVASIEKSTQEIEQYDLESNLYKDEIRNIAASLVEKAGKVKEGQKVLIWYDIPGLPLVHEVHNRCLAKGAKVDFFKRDLAKDAEEAKKLSPEELGHYHDEEKEKITNSDIVIIIRGAENPEIMGTVPEEKKKIYDEGYSQAHSPRVSDTVDWVLFHWPTEYAAKQEGVTYDRYIKEIMEASNQPWDEIKRVQEKLVEKLDKGKKLTLIANENNEDLKKRTHVEMSIEGMTFVNSTIGKNFPGSEVFSAPVMDSVNGQIFAEGKYEYRGHFMENIYFKIEKGKIIEAHADEGNERLQQILSQGEGARYFGEVALGTNPGLKRRFFDALLNEKIGGTFHMAIGHCYTFDEEDGKPVHVNNGNTDDRTPVHWDLTISMKNNGKVIIDDETVQENGRFLDSDLALLNPKE